MAIKYIPYTVQPLRGQAILPFLRYHSQLTAKDFVLKGLPYYETELVEKVNDGGDDLIIHGDCLNACAYLKEKNINVDLVYIDPPFASGANYAKKIYIRRNPKLVAKLEEAEEKLKKQRAEEGLELDNTDLQALEETMYGDIWQKEDYLNWIYERLLAIKEVMSDTASIYVHLDWHIGHYVKILMDEIFGEENFKNEIIWGYRRWTATSDTYQNSHDIIYFYSKNNKKVWNQPWENYADDASHFTEEDADGKFRWQYLRGKKYKLYMKEGTRMKDWWDDISYINSMATERVDYSTQKPEALLERIIKASSNEKMTVADLFGGSGVTAVVAHKLKRKFITADVGINSIQIIRDRLKEAQAKFDVIKIKDGIDLFRNPEQTMGKLATVIPGLTTKHDYGRFWFGAITEAGNVCPCWVPNLLNKSEAILNAALFTKILDETAQLENVSKIVICSVNLIDEKEINKMIADYDHRDSDGKKIEFIFKDLKELTDLLVYPDTVQYSVKAIGNKYEIVFERFISDNLLKKIHEFNSKKQKNIIARSEAIPFDRTEDQENDSNVITISEDGLELIEYISIDSTNNDGPWNSDQEIKIDKRGYVIRNGEKTKEFWAGKIIIGKKPLRLKIRNIAGDETLIDL